MRLIPYLSGHGRLKAVLSAIRAEIRKQKMKITYLHHYNSKRDVISNAKGNDRQAIKIMALEIALRIRDKKAVLVPAPSNNGLPIKLVRAIYRYTGNRHVNILTKKTNYSNCLLRKKGLKPFTTNQLLQLIEIRQKRKFNRVLLIDDVITSGNTVKACQMLINAKKVDALIYASASRKKDEFNQSLRTERRKNNESCNLYTRANL